MLECKFKFFKDTESKYDVSYTLFDEHGNVIDAGMVPYEPKTPIKTMNEAKHRVAQALSMRLKYTRPGVQIKMNCLNPASDFLTRSEMYRIARGLEEPQPTKPEASCVASDNDQQYEVVCVGQGLWTIRKSQTQYYTEQEAKTELFKRIVNGE